MTPIAAGFDQIRLLRRKIAIARHQIASPADRPARDAAMVELAGLTDDLIDALQAFADAGFEQQLVEILHGPATHDQPVWLDRCD